MNTFNIISFLILSIYLFNEVQKMFKYRRVYYSNDMITLDKDIDFYSSLFLSLDLKKDITILIDSNGGFNFYSRELIKKISKKNITCIALKAGSSSFDLFQFCDRRLVTPESILITHKAYISNPSLDYIVKNYDAIEKAYYEDLKINKIIAKRMNITYEEYEVKTRQDWKMNGYEAIKNKAADEMIIFHRT